MDPNSNRTSAYDSKQLAQLSQPLSLQPCLVEVSGSMPGRTYCLTSPVYLVGRDDLCAIQVDLDGVSRRHCEFVQSAKGYTVNDLGSTNGIYVNGERCESRQLAEGDRLALGPNAIYTYRIYQVDEGVALSNIAEGVTKDSETGAINQGGLVEWLQTQLTLGQQHDFKVGLLVVGAIASDVALKLYGCLKKHKTSSMELARLGPLEFSLAIPYTRESELDKLWTSLSPDLEQSCEFGAGLATSRSTASATPEKLIREAMQKLKLALLDIPNVLIR